MAIVPLPSVSGDAARQTGLLGRHRAAGDARGAEPVPGSPPAQGSVLPQMTALDTAVAEALARQDGLAAVFARAAALAGEPDLPAPLAALLRALPEFAVDGSVGPEALRDALARSGLFGEAAARAGTPTVDLKVALQLLARLLASWTATAPDGSPAIPPIPAAVPGTRRPDPPRSRGPIAGQPPADLEDRSDPRLAALELAAAADRAVARIVLHQAASLGDPADPRPTDEAPHPLIAEIPLAGPGGISIAQLRVSRDDHRGEAGGGDRRSWRVELAVDVAPLGPVSARVGLLPGRRLVVGLWCESRTGRDRLAGEIPRLRAALESAGLDVAPVDLHLGRPPLAEPPPVAPPHRLDVEL